MSPGGALIAGPREGIFFSWRGERGQYLAIGDATHNTYALVRGPVPPGSGPPPHVQRREDEGFYVLSGSLAFTAGSAKVTVPRGGFLNVRSGTAHTFRNEGREPADVLVFVAPAGFDRFQLEVGRRLEGPDAPPDPPSDAEVARLRAAAPRYGIEIDPPRAAFERVPEITVRQPGEGRAYDVVGDRYTFLASGAETGGRYALVEAIVPPGGGPPPHRHSREEEAFFVLDGRVRFTADGRSTDAGPGTFVHLPSGSTHSFRNETGSPARMLILVAPAGFENLFVEIGRPVTDRRSPPAPPNPATIERLLAAAPRYGLEIFPPQPG